MARIRRTTHLAFSFEDVLFFDIPLLLRRSAAQKPLKQILAFSVLTGKEYAVNMRILQILFDIPSDNWTLDRDIVEEHRIELSFIEELARKGLILSDHHDRELSELRKRDELLSSTQWNKYASLYHYMGKWKDMHLRDNLPENVEQFGKISATSEDVFKQFVARYGKPPSHFHTIPNPLEIHDLPLIKREGDLYRTLTDRKTTRAFDPGTPMTIDELSVILYYVYGCHGYAPIFEDIIRLKKTSPSGGGLHPTEVYPLIINVAGLDPGIYHYNVKNHRLDLIVGVGEDEARELANESTAGQSYARWAHALFIMTARFYRHSWKYRRHSRSYSVLAMDVAHLSQSFYLVCTDLGLGAFVTAAINAVNIEQRLGLDGVTEGAVAVCGCGKVLESNLGLDPEYFPYIPRETEIGD
jgi:putative peptide maturation dehydrogenase